MRIKLLFLSVLLVADLSAQQVITVRPQHSKKLIRTLEKDEILLRGESKIMVRFDGEDYEYITWNTKKYRHYRNDQFLEEGPYAHILWDQKSCYSMPEMVDGKYKMMAMVNGKKIGPYDELQITRYFDYEKNKLYAYHYRENGSYYLKDEVHGKLYGPYEELMRHGTLTKELFFKYKKGGKWYLHDEDRDFGPFDEVHGMESSTGRNGLIYTYAINNVWRISAKDTVPLQFTADPFFNYDSNGKWKAMGIPVGSTKSWVFSQDGGKWEHTSLNQVVWSAGNRPLTAVPVNAAGANEQNLVGWFTPRFESNQWYELRDGEQVIGTFMPANLAVPPAPTPYYPVALYKLKEGTTTVDRTVFYLYKTGAGLVGPIPAEAQQKLALCGDSYRYVAGEDKVLYVDGQPTAHKQVLQVDFSEFPDRWLMAKKQGYYTVFYKNGVLDKTGELQKKWGYSQFDTRDKPYIFVESNDKTYAKSPTSEKLFGPVKQRSVIAFSKDNKHYAEGDERAAQILIDGKVVSSGYALVYNPAKNAFHWISQEGSQLYFHTYELD